MSERELKVWVHLDDLMQDLRRGWSVNVYPRRDGFKARVRATLIIPAPKKRKVLTKSRNRGEA